MSIRTFIIATSVSGGLALCSAGAAGATSTGESAKTVLDQLCEQRGGMPVFTPYAIARCQGARANKGFETERLTCEDLRRPLHRHHRHAPHEPRLVGMHRDVARPVTHVRPAEAVTQPLRPARTRSPGVSSAPRGST